MVATATAGHAAAANHERATAATALTQTYHLTIQVLIKLHEDAMAWSAMDRATHTARAADNPLLSAETARASAIVLRRTRHGQRAQQTLLRAAQSLDESTGLRLAGQVAAYGRLLATAAYVALYRVSVARVLGDFGAAVQYARALRPDQLGSVERRARYWEDYALALHGRGAYAESFRALQAAERAAPQEVRYRPWAQQLNAALLDADRRQALPGLRSFAARIGTPT
ncbi:hypothetical protein [Micromonospora sp. NPDC005305]|uniref:hypothetical protein n=1 Tax=Micromonospora sp. NPDC005305 TaxID=3156875 RepID=UPI0033B77A7A